MLFKKSCHFFFERRRDLNKEVTMESFMTPQANSSGMSHANVRESNAKRALIHRYKTSAANLERLMQKVNQYDFLHQVNFCDLYQTENCDLREVIQEYVDRSRMVSVKLELEELMISDVEMADDGFENDASSVETLQDFGATKPEVEKRLRPPVTNKKIFSQGGTPLYAPVVRPNIQLPMSDGGICNLVVKEEDIVMPVLSENDTEMLANIKTFIDKIVKFNKK